ncbi:MAG: plastocyanin/azurin family copper-binding protein [Chloroflexota bacterium]
MTRIDFGGALMALFTGFILSAGITGFVLSAGGYQFPGARMAGPDMMAGTSMMTGAGPAVAAPAPAVQAQTQAQAAPAGQVAAEQKVVATDLKFTPPALQAKVGQPVKIVLENKGVIEHDIAFPTMQSDKPVNSLKAVVKSGQTGALEFTPSVAGTYEYICTIPGHKEAGMKGTINVVK